MSPIVWPLWHALSPQVISRQATINIGAPEPAWLAPEGAEEFNLLGRMATHFMYVSVGIAGAYVTQGAEGVEVDADGVVAPFCLRFFIASSISRLRSSP